MGISQPTPLIGGEQSRACGFQSVYQYRTPVMVVVCLWIVGIPSAMTVVSDGEEGNLLQVRVVPIFVGAALRRRNLLEGCARRQLTMEILHIHFIKCPHVG
jgi:hypothetical protein